MSPSAQGLNYRSACDRRKNVSVVAANLIIFRETVRWKSSLKSETT